MFNKTQVYSQLSFTCPKNESIVEFKQELKDGKEILLDDIADIDCRSVQTLCDATHVGNAQYCCAVFTVLSKVLC